MTDAILNAGKDKKITLNANEKKEMLDACIELHSHTSHIIDAVKNGYLMKSDVEAYLSLARHHFDDIAKLSGSSEIFDNELSETRSMLRDANAEIYRMRKDKSKGISAENTGLGIEKFERLFSTWYSLSGLDYMSLEFNSRGIVARSSSSLYEQAYEKDTDGRLHFDPQVDKDIAPKLIDKITYAFGNCDARDDATHKELLDTDKNRREIENIFKAAFPNYRIYEFSSRPDREQYLLRFKAFVSYKDIESLFNKLLSE